MKTLKKYHVGEQFGRLVAISDTLATNKGPATNCRCSCGKEKVILNKHLLSGRIRSCGCLRAEVSYLLSGVDADGNFKASALREYNSFNSGMQRCTNPKAHAYDSVGGSGIKFHDAWMGDFPRFMRDLGHAKPGQILIRRNLRKDYSPENCFWGEWSDFGESMKQRRQTRPLELLESDQAA